MFNFESKICKKCGKHFIPAPYHAYQVNNDLYCSWTCYNHRNDGKRKRNLKTVGQYTADGELIKVFPSAKEAAEALDCSYHTITCACRKGIQALGFLWKYE